MKMKYFFVLLLVFACLPNIHAQMGESDLKSELLALLKSKHDYEKFTRINAEKGVLYKEKYTQSFARVVDNQESYLAYINRAIKDDETLSKRYVFYDYQSPLSSRVDPKNVITQLVYFKVVKYCLENKKDLLPEISDPIFLKLQQDTTEEIFNSVPAMLEPLGGMDAFFDRLAIHLSSSKELPDTYLHFYVGKGGKFYVEDDSAKAAILNSFIRKEGHWSPGIHSGPTELTCIYVELPIQKDKKVIYQQHIAYSDSPKSKGLYYSDVYPDYPYVHEVVSVINENGRYSAPIVHKGNSADAIIAFLTDPNTLVRGDKSKSGRIYFYKLKK